jgi:hypothetical protein
MDLEDLFDGGSRRDKRGYRDQEDRYGGGEGQSRTYDDHQDDRGRREGSDRWSGYSDRDRQHGRHGSDDLFDIEQLLPRLLANKKLLALAAVVLVVIAALAAIFLLPLAGQAVAYIEKSGITGVVDTVQKATGGGK